MEKNILKEILMSDNLVVSTNNNLDKLLDLIPELKDMIGFQHNHPHHHLDVWNHTLLALELSPKEFDIRLALLLHDIGKPHSYQDKEIRHFKDHPKVSGTMSKIILERLNFNKEEIKEICYLIENHDLPILKKDLKNNKELTIKRFKIQICDALAHNKEKLEKRLKYLYNINSQLNNTSTELITNSLTRLKKKYQK